MRESRNNFCYLSFDWWANCEFSKYKLNITWLDVSNYEEILIEKPNALQENIVQWGFIWWIWCVFHFWRSELPKSSDELVPGLKSTVRWVQVHLKTSVQRHTVNFACPMLTVSDKHTAWREMNIVKIYSVDGACELQLVCFCTMHNISSKSNVFITLNMRPRLPEQVRESSWIESGPEELPIRHVLLPRLTVHGWRQWMHISIFVGPLHGKKT